MSLLRIATANLLETATSVTDTGTPAAGYPITRLFDRNIEREYRIAEDVARETIVTGGISAVEVNALIDAPGHNIGGLAHTLARSANGTDYTTVATGTLAAGTGVIVTEFAAVAAAYWRRTLPTNADVTQTELMLTNILTVERNPARPSGALETRYNVSVEETASGRTRYLSNGPARRRRAYEWKSPGTISAATAAEIQARTEALGGVKPFWLCDHTGAWIWGNLEEPVAPAEVAYGRCEMSFNFLEVL